MRYWAHHESGSVFKTPDDIADEDRCYLEECCEIDEQTYIDLVLGSGYDGEL